MDDAWKAWAPEVPSMKRSKANESRRSDSGLARPHKTAIELAEMREEEKRTLALMVGIYCKGNRHKNGAERGPGPRGTGLCPRCQELVAYCFERIDRCPRMEVKTFCSACPTHCYKPDMLERVRAVMAYAGPRMILHDPAGAIRHLRYGRPARESGR